ncbi:hypothetical protein B5M09_010240 [Aphanomyces astaci]|uniref:RNase III domain-containing protein n=1 Tax=Aphanomyces astaci TaxID=112090 RepID=A0A3R7WFP5_APHAT|nr:hypothetical protein B5M09_010240 [Aphanomyces astaci]
MVLRLTDAQNATILAIAETIVGPLPDDVAKDIVSEHMDTVRNLSEGTDEAAGTPTEDELLATTQVHPRELGLLASVEVMLHKLPKDRWSEFEKVLYLLSTGWGTKVVTASARMVPFHELTVGEREDALRNLTLSSFAKVRSLFQVFKALVSFCMFAKTRSVHGKLNPLWENLHYPGRPEEKKRPPRSQFWEPTFEDMTAMAKVAGKGNPITLETDVVVIGSGAGGGVVGTSAELAQAGHRVLVLEKAVYFHPADASFNELQGFWDHYESAALLTSEDLSMMLLAGSASLPPPHELCHEWATTYNLPYFKSQAFQDAISTVCTRAGVSAEAVLHNVPNQVLLDGAIKLGYPVEAVPQNTNGHVHECGFCTLGCPYGEKQGSHVTWLRDAADAGAKFVDGCYVDKVTYVKDAASGVEATVLNGSVRLVVKAKTVVCCAGSLHTPALLLRSGLRNPNIGRHLRLHPVATEAITHPSVAQWLIHADKTTTNVVWKGDYERLEYLGDALIEYLVVTYAYIAHPTWQPGALTDWKGATVSNDALGKAALICFHIDQIMLTGSMRLDPLLVDKLADLKRLHAEGSSERPHVTMPKIFADGFEALCAAVFLDAGCDLHVIRDIFLGPLLSVVGPDAVAHVTRKNTPKPVDISPPPTLSTTDAAGENVEEDNLRHGEDVRNNDNDEAAVKPEPARVSHISTHQQPIEIIEIEDSDDE